MDDFKDGDILWNKEGMGDYWIVDGTVVKLIFDGRLQHEESLDFIQNYAKGFVKVGEWK
jgi:hypothetical protein